jgi:hypothetical protein
MVFKFGRTQHDFIGRHQQILFREVEKKSYVFTRLSS